VLNSEEVHPVKVVSKALKIATTGRNENLIETYNSNVIIEDFHYQISYFIMNTPSLKTSKGHWRVVYKKHAEGQRRIMRSLQSYFRLV
jgi:hypothetical protein